MNLIDLVWSFLAAIVSTTYFFLIKSYAQKQQLNILFAVFFLELLVIYLYYKSLQHVRSGIIYAFINGFSVIIGLIIAIMVFGEKYTMTDIIGLSLIVIGIILVGKR